MMWYYLIMISFLAKNMVDRLYIYSYSYIQFLCKGDTIFSFRQDINSFLFSKLLKMNFRMRNLKENKKSSNSTVQLPKHINLSSPKCLDFELSQKVSQLEVRLSNIAEWQKIENENCRLIYQKLEKSVLQLNDRIGNFKQQFFLQPNVLLQRQKNEMISHERNISPRHSYPLPQENNLFKQNVLTDISFQKEELKSQNTKYELIERRQAKLQQQLKAFINSHSKPIFERKFKQKQQKKVQITQCQIQKVKLFDDMDENQQNFTNKKSQSNAKEIKKLNQLIDSLRIQFEGKLKAYNDRLLLDLSLKYQFDLKVKKEEDKQKSIQIQRKFNDCTTALKAEIDIQITKKIHKITDEEFQKMSTKLELATISIKKEILADIEKDRSICYEEINRAKVQFEGRIKARDEKSQFNPKKQAEIKKRQEQIKTKFGEINKKMGESSYKLKMEILGQVNRSRATHIDLIDKMKLQIVTKIQDFEAVRSRCNQQSNLKQKKLQQKYNNIQQMEKQLDKLQHQLMRQLQQLDHQNKNSQQVLKKDLFEHLMNSNNNLQDKISTLHHQTQCKVNQITKSLFNINSKQEKIFQQTSAQISQLKSHIEQSLKKLNNERLQNQKLQSAESITIQSKLIQPIKSDLMGEIKLCNDRLQKLHQYDHERLTQHIAHTELLKTQTFSQINTVSDVVKKIQLSLFTEKENNQAVYKKISSDLLDITDHLTLILTEMKPYRQS